jgi:hypothetical protein
MTLGEKGLRDDTFIFITAMRMENARYHKKRSPVHQKEKKEGAVKMINGR